MRALTLCAALFATLSSPISASNISDLTISPVVLLDNATVLGVNDGITHSFFSIPYGKPPIGDLRFSSPLPTDPYHGTINATTYKNTCYPFLPVGRGFPSYITQEQAEYIVSVTLPSPVPSDEDCLNLNVVVPANVLPGSKLPVVAYIFYGAFRYGGSYDVDGKNMVNRSITLGEPVVWVSMNHRLGPLGWLPGKEMKDAKAGNLGLQDQRIALRWIQKYIFQFGGDPDRVTLVGFSSGAVSAAMHTLVNDENTEGLFHAIWTESGAVQPLGWIDQPSGQGVYDNYVTALNCSTAADTLACIRAAPVEAVTNASALGVVSWQPHADGVLLKDLPQDLLASGRAARVPAVAGDLTRYQMYSNDALLAELTRGEYYNSINDTALGWLFQLYPNNASLGAPYGTGEMYEYFPMYKRVASLQGDIGIDSIRRLYVQTASRQGNNVWSYLYERHNIPGFGSTHGSEIPDMYYGGDMQAFFIHFANHQDPNSPEQSTYWPPYRADRPSLMHFYGNSSTGIINDTYRAEGIEFIITLNREIQWPE